METLYRYISKEEYNELLSGKTIKSIEHDSIYTMKETLQGKLLHEKFNYKLSVEEWNNFNAQNINIPYNKALDFMIGTVSEDYLIELSFPKSSINETLGWYYHSENSDGSLNEVCFKEYLIPEYSLNNVISIKAL